MEKNENIVQNILDEIIRSERFGDAKVTFGKVPKGGYLSVPSSIIIEGKDKNGKPKALNLFMKTIPPSEAVKKQMSLEDLFAREIHVYSAVFPHFFQFQEEKQVTEPFLSIPKLYGFCLNKGGELLILEDLVKVGYTLWDKRKCMTSDTVAIILREYAKYHALSLAFKDQRPSEFIELTKTCLINILERNIQNFKTAAENSIQQAIQCLDPVTEKDAIERLSKLLPYSSEVMKISDPDKSVLIHGDCWCNNYMMLFDDSKNITPTKVVFLDWQLSMLASPVMDLSYFFYCNAPKECLDNLDDCLNIYYETLQRVTKELGSDVEKIFPFSKLKEHWKKYCIFGLIMSCVVISGVYEHGEDLPSMSETLEKGGSLEHFFKAEVKHPQYKERMRNVLLHFVQNKFV